MGEFGKVWFVEARHKSLGKWGPWAIYLCPPQARQSLARQQARNRRAEHSRKHHQFRAMPWVRAIAKKGDKRAR